MIFAGYILISQQQDIFKEEMERRGRLLTGTLSKISREALFIYEFSTLSQNVKSFEEEKDVISAKIINNNGRIVASINSSEEGRFTVENYEFDEGQKYRENSLVSVENINVNDENIGKAVIVLSLNSMHDKISYSVKMIIYILAVSFLFLLFIINIFSGYLLQPVVSLANVVREIPEKDFKIEKLKEKNPPIELKELYNSIIWMYEEMLTIRKRFVERTQMATIGKMSAYFAHEIRNPLEAMSGAVEVIKMRGKANSDDFFDIIKEEIMTLNEFLNEFLDFTRLKSYEFEKLNLNKVIKDIITLLEPMSKAKNIDFIYEKPEEEFFIEGDVNKVKSVFANIFLNSMEAIEEVGLIKIQFRKEDGFIFVCIEDNGKGFPDGDIDKIFNPFFTTKKSGNGIGLSIAKEIIESHNGEILVELGKTTMFTIKLPLVKG